MSCFGENSFYLENIGKLIENSKRWSTMAEHIPVESDVFIELLAPIHMDLTLYLLLHTVGHSEKFAANSNHEQSP